MGYLTLILRVNTTLEPTLPEMRKLPALEMESPGRVSDPDLEELILPREVDVEPLEKITEKAADGLRLVSVSK